MTHGESAEVDVGVFLGPDPDLAMVTAPMKEWAEAHPCDCDALCVCEEDEWRSSSRAASAASR